MVSKTRDYSSDERVAHHEAGHALLAYLVGRGVTEVSIVSDGDVLGRCLLEPFPGDLDVFAILEGIDRDLDDDPALDEQTYFRRQQQLTDERNELVDEKPQLADRLVRDDIKIAGGGVAGEELLTGTYDTSTIG